ncbi:MAG: phycocyanobilin:ferredoxin oxidoreductase [Pseudanabaenaceae cyanobacterium bins.68]|nr:phycocyanobilin:ferredoxin oxidoreductase [Pseudanabaenaceae cyanobacterium bins.68]
MQLHPLIQALAEQIQSTWQTHLQLTPYPMPEDLGYVEGKLEGERVQIQNFCYQTPEFRKLHLELAQVGNNLDILHCVMFPRSNYNLPIFGADLVGSRHGISAAIADLSPMLPFSPDFEQALTQWQPLRHSFSQPRELPTWGNIFSPYCVFVRLDQPLDQSSEGDRFLKLAIKYIQLTCNQAPQALVDTSTAQQVFSAQRHYCEQQRRNDKTRRILEKAFGSEWAERYMTTILFDVL